MLARLFLWLTKRHLLVEINLIILGIFVEMWTLFLRHGFRWTMEPAIGRLGGDGYTRYQTLERLFQGHIVSSDVYSVILGLCAAPLYLLGKLLGHPADLLGLFNPILFISSLGIIYFGMRKSVDQKLLVRFLLLMVFASMYANHIQLFYAEVFTSFLVFFGIWAYLKDRKLLAILLIALGTANTPAVIGGTALLAAWLWTRPVSFSEIAVAWRNETSGILQKLWAGGKAWFAQADWWSLGLVVGSLVLILSENWIRHGSPVGSGYATNVGERTFMPFSGQPGFSYPILFGLLGILFSFGKGLLWYIPAAFLPFRQWTKQLGPFVADLIFGLLTFSFGLLPIYSLWWSWWGGWFWGPRFFLILCIPACWILAVATLHWSRKLITNILIILVTIWTIWVGFSGQALDQSGGSRCLYEPNFEPICLYVPEFAPLFSPFYLGLGGMAKFKLIILGLYVVVALWVVLPGCRKVYQEVRGK